MSGDIQNKSTETSNFMYHSPPHRCSDHFHHPNSNGDASKPDKSGAQGSHVICISGAIILCDVELRSWLLAMRWCPITGRHDWQPQQDADCGEVKLVSIGNRSL